MDFFGIGAAMKAMVAVYTLSSRRSGRTTALIEGIKDGDRIVFSNAKEARRVEQLCRDRGLLNVAYLVLQPKEAHRIFDYPSVAGEGRNIFDHTWVEEYYANALDRAADEIDRFERETSGYGEAHRATRRSAIEISKWMR